MRVRIREAEGTTYITCTFEKDRIPYQASITVYSSRVNCEVVPPGFAAKEFVDRLKRVLGEPVEGPRVRSSHSDCGEETGSLVVSWKIEGGREECLKRIRSTLSSAD